MTPLEHIDFHNIGYWTKPIVVTKTTLSDKQQGIFYMYFPTDMTAHTTAFDGPVVDHWLEWKIAQTANASALQARSDDSNLYM